MSNLIILASFNYCQLNWKKISGLSRTSSIFTVFFRPRFFCFKLKDYTFNIAFLNGYVGTRYTVNLVCNFQEWYSTGYSLMLRILYWLLICIFVMLNMKVYPNLCQGCWQTSWCWNKCKFNLIIPKLMRISVPKESQSSYLEMYK